MSPSQDEPARDQSAASELIPPGAERERGPVPYPEGPPLMSLFAAALFSFVFLNTAFWTMFPFLSEFLTDEGGLGPLLLPTISDSLMVEALVGTAVLTIISLTILLAERHLKFSWLASLRRIVPRDMGSDLAVGSGAWRFLGGVACVRSHDRGDLLPALGRVLLGAIDLGLTAYRSGRPRR